MPQATHSSYVRSVRHDPISKTLTVIHHDGQAYQYKNVPDRVFEALRASPSIGRFIASQIRPNYALID